MIVPDYALLTFWETNKGYVTGAVSVVVALQAFNNQSKRIRRGVVTSLFIAVQATAVLGALTYIGGARLAALGGATVLTYVTQTTAETLPVEITERGPGSRRRGCDHVLWVRPLDWPDDAVRICDVPKNIWNAAQPGQQVVLSGVRGYSGFRVRAISLPTQ